MTLSTEAQLFEWLQTFEEIEVLVRLRHEPHRLWTELGLAVELRRPEASVEAVVASLEIAGLVQRHPADGPQLRYANASAEQERALASLVEDYENRRFELITFLRSRRSRNGRV